MNRPVYTVCAERSDGWWKITSPDVPGFVSQVRELADAEEYAWDGIAFILGVPDDSFDVTVRLRCFSEHPATGERCERAWPHTTAHMAGTVADGTAAYWQNR